MAPLMAAACDAQADFLVVGAGIAGLRAALELARAGHVLVLAKGHAADPSLPHAKPCLACSASDDEVVLSEHDTLQAGDGLCRPAAVHALLEEAPARIQEVIEWGAELHPSGAGLALARSTSLNRPRVLRLQESQQASLGGAIMHVLRAKAQSMPAIEIVPRTTVVELLREGPRVTGALYLTEDRVPRYRRTRAKAVLLATGGLGQLYRETTSPPSACGDGIALAFAAGAVLEDLEFVQFYPTCLHARGAPHLPLPAALLEHGAKLLNVDLERFMPRYHEAGDRAPADAIARAIVQEMRNSRSECVYLDLTAVGPDRLRKRFPALHLACVRHNLDIAADLVPVLPAAHFTVGGVAVGLNGATSVPRLYAAGEVAASGVHGANAWGANALLEGLVFGARAAKAMIAGERPSVWPTPPARTSDSPSSTGEVPTSCVALDAESLVREVRCLMWHKVGIIRRGSELAEASRCLDSLVLAETAVPSRSYYEARHILAVARLLARCAAKRAESRGAHYREDFPLRDDSLPPRHSYVSVPSPVYLAA